MFKSLYLRSYEADEEETKQVKIYIDPLEVDEIDYQCIISFKIYSESFTELFNGGFYEVNGERCIGFSGLVESLIKK